MCIADMVYMYEANNWKYYVVRFEMCIYTVVFCFM